MINTDKINEIVQKITSALPSGIQQLPKDAEKTIRTVLQGAFSKMDLVTREDFDAQSKVLARTREKLEALEKRLTELEKAD